LKTFKAKQLFTRLLETIRTLKGVPRILLWGIVVYVIVLSVITSLKYYCFETYTFDLGIFVQVFWHTLHGNFMFSQPRAGPLHPPSFLGVHVSPLIILLLPFYAIFQSPYTLLVLQTIALALPAAYIYGIGVKINEGKNLALIFALGYLLYPGTLWSNWYDFHLESFVPLFSSMIFYHYMARNKWRLILSFFLLLATFERALIIALAFVVYIFVREAYLSWKNRGTHRTVSKGMILGLIVIVGVSLAYFFLSENIMNSIWPQRGTSSTAEFLGVINYNDILVKIAYVGLLTAPLAFLPFESPLELLPAIPYLLLSVVSSYSPYFTITWQYPALISVPFFVSAMFGATHHKWKRTGVKLAVALTICTVLFSPGTPLMSRLSINWALPVPNSETLLMQQALETLDQNASVLAQENIFPNIAERRIAYTYWPANYSPPDYIVINVLDLDFYRTPDEQSTRDALFGFLSTQNYGIIENVNGFFILKKDYDGQKNVLVPLHLSLQLDQVHKKIISFEDQFLETHFFVPDWVKVEGDHLLLSKNFSGNAWWGPYITVPPGRYKIEVKYSLSETTERAVFGLSAYWFKHATYGEKTIWGNQTLPGQIGTVSMEFETSDWVPALEIVGTGFGNADVSVYSVTMLEVQ